MGLVCEFPYAEMQAFSSLTSISFQGNAITGDVEVIGTSLRGLLGHLTYLDLLQPDQWQLCRSDPAVGNAFHAL